MKKLLCYLIGGWLGETCGCGAIIILNKIDFWTITFQGSWLAKMEEDISNITFGPRKIIGDRALLYDWFLLHDNLRAV